MTFMEKYDINEIIFDKEEDLFVTKIYQGVCFETGEEVVIKENTITPKEDYKGDISSTVASYENRFYQEAVVMNKLKGKSPYIVKLYDYFHNLDLKQFVIVMEKVEGIKLDNFFKERQKQLCKKNYLRFLWFFIDALNIIHKNGVVHRDLSSGNIFLQFRGDTLVGIKIIDFGFAYHKSMGIRNKMAITSFYSPPEALNRVTLKVTERFDFYSAGVIMYQALEGCLPTKIPIAKRREDLKVREITNREISSKIKDFIYKCLSYSPKDRPKSIIEVKSAIHRELKREGIKI